MAYEYYNPNPDNKRVGDCVIRAITKLLNSDWETIFLELSMLAYSEHDMPSANHVWGKYLASHGYKRRILPDTCPACYTCREFAKENPYGRYLLATGSHVIAVIDGVYYDTWDSGDEVPAYYWYKEEN